jgi:hypothetical protein
MIVQLVVVRPASEPDQGRLDINTVTLEGADIDDAFTASVGDAVINALFGGANYITIQVQAQGG